MLLSFASRSYCQGCSCSNAEEARTRIWKARKSMLSSLSSFLLIQHSVKGLFHLLQFTFQSICNYNLFIRFGRVNETSFAILTFFFSSSANLSDRQRQCVIYDVRKKTRNLFITHANCYRIRRPLNFRNSFTSPRTNSFLFIFSNFGKIWYDLNMKYFCLINMNISCNFSKLHKKNRIGFWILQI